MDEEHTQVMRPDELPSAQQSSNPPPEEEPATLPFNDRPTPPNGMSAAPRSFAPSEPIHPSEMARLLPPDL